MSSSGAPPRRPPGWVPTAWLIGTFVALLGAATYVGTNAVERWDRGLKEDRVVHRALAYARAAARLTEAGGGAQTPHLRAFGNAVGDTDPDVLRLAVIDVGKVSVSGAARDQAKIWALDGSVGPIGPLDSGLANKANYLSDHFESEPDPADAEDGATPEEPVSKTGPIPLIQLVEVTTDEPGVLRVAAYAPVVFENKMVGLAGALLYVTAPAADPPTAIWLLALLVALVFSVGVALLPGHRRIVTGGVLLALSLSLAWWIPTQVSSAIEQHLVERADDWLAIQAKADSHAPIALAAPIPDREAWSHDGAIRLERGAASTPVSDIGVRARRVGHGTAAVHLHEEVATSLGGGLDLATLAWALAGALLFFFALVPVARLIREVRTQPKTFLYVAPAIVGMVVLVFIPFITGVGLSFYKYHLAGSSYEFIGFGNFAEIIAPSAGAGVHFWRTLGVTTLWTTLNVFLHVSLGLGIALVLNQTRLRGKGIYRVLLILPWAIPSYITALLWRAMFLEEGPIAAGLGVVGIGPISWFDDNFLTNFIPNLVTNTWLGFPFMMVVAMGALQSIPTDLYEAAELDGASAWQRFRHITLPLLRPALLPAVILGSIWTFNQFNVIYLVSMGRGHTEILITEAYKQFHQFNRYGYAAAYAFMIFLILLAYTWVTARVSKGVEGATA